jgi:pantetheine-phosphate adenylyltransferase
MNKTAVFPGSFDPVTRGHEWIVRMALPLFDSIIVAVGENSGKQSYFPAGQRLRWLAETFSGEPKVTVSSYSGLTVDFCRQAGAGYILRGLRTAADFEFERSIAHMNRALAPGIETIFLLCDPQYSALSSSIVRDIHRHGGDITMFVPEKIKL